MSPVPDDGTVEPLRTIPSFGEAVMTFGGCSSPRPLVSPSPSSPKMFVFLQYSPHPLSQVDQYQPHIHDQSIRMDRELLSLAGHFGRSFCSVPVLYSLHFPPSFPLFPPPSPVGKVGGITCSWSRDVRPMLTASPPWPCRLDHFRQFLCI